MRKFFIEVSETVIRSKTIEAANEDAAREIAFSQDWRDWSFDRSTCSEIESITDVTEKLKP